MIRVRGLSVNLPLRRARLRRRLLSGHATSGGEVISVKGRPYTAALNMVSFDIAPGDNVALIGVNGSGKTTLLRALAGIYEPSAGSIEIDGRVSTMFSNATSLSDMETGLQNLETSAILHGLPRRDYLASLPEVTDICGLGEFINVPVSMYSEGMKARLGLAMAVQVNPSTLLIDEAIAQTDQRFIADVSKRSGLFRKADQITLLASHARNIQDKYCNKAIWLDRGHLKAVGPYVPVRESFDADLDETRFMAGA